MGGAQRLRDGVEDEPLCLRVRAAYFKLPAGHASQSRAARMLCCAQAGSDSRGVICLKVEDLTSLAEGKPKFSCALTDGADSITAVLATQVLRAQTVLSTHAAQALRALLARGRPTVFSWAALPSRYIRAAHSHCAWQVNVRVAAGEIKAGTILRLTEYTINTVNGATRPLVLGAAQRTGSALCMQSALASNDAMKFMQCATHPHLGHCEQRHTTYKFCRQPPLRRRPMPRAEADLREPQAEPTSRPASAMLLFLRWALCSARPVLCLLRAAARQTATWWARATRSPSRRARRARQPRRTERRTTTRTSSRSQAPAPATTPAAPAGAAVAR